MTDKIEFIKPTVKYNDDFDKLKEYEVLAKVKVYDRGEYNPEPYKTSKELIDKFKEFEEHMLNHKNDIVGKLYSAANNYIRDVKLNECVTIRRGYDSYLNEDSYNQLGDRRPVKETMYYKVYSGFKFKMKDNHVYNWFPVEERKQFNAPVPQQLDEKGYVNMVEDTGIFVTVNYGTGLIQQEMKDVYCSTNGRYIKYKGKNYYIKEKE